MTDITDKVRNPYRLRFTLHDGAHRFLNFKLGLTDLLHRTRFYRTRADALSDWRRWQELRMRRLERRKGMSRWESEDPPVLRPMFRIEALADVGKAEIVDFRGNVSETLLFISSGTGAEVAS